MQKSQFDKTDDKTYAEHWDKESNLFFNNGTYKELGSITPSGNVLEIGSGNGLSTLELSISRKILAIDNNPYLVEMARPRLQAAGANAEIVLADIFQPSAECINAIKEFTPEVIVCWLMGSSANTYEKHLATNIPINEQPKKYRENVEDILLTLTKCQPSVQWVHLANRAIVNIEFDENFIKSDAKDDYDKHVFMPNEFEVIDVQILDWKKSGSNFPYQAAPHRNFARGINAEKIVSILAKRKESV